jgi:hypothetical protein
VTAETSPVEPSASEAKPRDTAETKPHDTAETKPHDTAETKPHDTAETKPHSPESFEAEIRAALAKGESAKPVPVAPSRQSAIPANVYRAPPAADTQPRQTEAATGAIPVAPRTTDAEPQQAPVLPEPPTTVEIKSLPVAGVDSAPASDPAPQAQAEAQPAGNSFSSFFNFLSPDSHPQVPADKAPRPPMPVGQ